MIRRIIIFIFIFRLAVAPCFSQENIKSRMRHITIQLLDNLQRNDTTAIMQMYDVMYSQINKKNFYDFTLQHARQYCRTYNKIIARHGMPDLKKLIFLTDTTNGANIAMLPLITVSDTLLNIQKCALRIMFYPGRFFIQNKILEFSLLTEPIHVNTNIIKLAPPHKNI